MRVLSFLSSSSSTKSLPYPSNITNDLVSYLKGIHRITESPNITTLPNQSAAVPPSAPIATPPSTPCVPYRAAFALQTAIIRHCMDYRHESSQSSPQSPPANNKMDSLIILQHSPVYTLGRRGDVHNFLFSQNRETEGLLKRGGGAAPSAGEGGEADELMP